ncbi:MAG: hypothetical protein LBP76_08870 [Treponema sp.]|jgi:hypothetical protein|nr:hypothetical protein [Treponema sp.]
MFKLPLLFKRGFRRKNTSYFCFRISAPQKRFSAPRSRLVLPPLIFLLALTFFLFPVYAQESDSLDTGLDEDRPVKVLRPGGPLNSSIPAEETPEYARLILEGILQSPDMGGTQNTWGIRFKESNEERNGEEAGETPPWMEAVNTALAGGLRFILVLGIAAFAVFALLYFYRKYKGGGSPLKAVQNSVASDPAISAEFYLTEARRFRDQGRLREAWAACLAGILAAFKLNRGISIPAAATEYGCLALISAALRQSAGGEQQQKNTNPGSPIPRELEEFTGLVHNWVYFAYADRLPPEGAFEKALNFGLSLLVPESPGRDSEEGKRRA